MRTLSLPLLAFALLGALACGDSGNPTANTGNNTSNNGQNNGDTNNGDTNNGDTNNGDTNNGDTNNGDANNGGEVVSFTECDADGMCNGSQACVQGVCVEKPNGQVEGEARLERGDATWSAGPPEIGCYLQSVPAPGPVQYVPVEGNVQKFGVGGATVGLCVTVYNGDRFLEHFLSICNDIDDPAARQECFQPDPCRCEDEFEGDQGAIDECFQGIGYCNGIQDATRRAACQETFAFDGQNPDRDPAVESTLIYGHATSAVVAEGSDEGFYRLEGVPTQTRLVFKVSGRLNRWIDTYEFGAFLAQTRERDGQTYARWEANVISIGAWNTIPSTALVPQGIQAANGAIAGTISDCGQEGRAVDVNGESVSASFSLPIKNATVGLTYDATRITYFNGNPSDTLPLPSQVTTNNLGVYAAINVPGGPNRVSTAMYRDGELINIGYRDIFMPPRSVSISTFESNWEPEPW